MCLLEGTAFQAEGTAMRRSRGGLSLASLAAISRTLLPQSFPLPPGPPSPRRVVAGPGADEETHMRICM